MKQKSSGAITCLLATALSGCSPAFGLFAPAGPVAAAQQAHLLSILFWMAFVLVPLFVGIAFVVWRYRLGSGAPYRPRWEFSWLLEIAVWGGPVVIVVILGWMLWWQTSQLDPYTPRAGGTPLRVEVVGYDWKWLFVYPDQGVALVNQLVLPRGRPVTFDITSGTVLQSFMIPELGGQIYAMPNMKTVLNLRADQTGVFRGQNTQYNGEGFANQKFDVRVVEPARFDTVLGGLTGGAPPLGVAAVQDLEKRSIVKTPMAFGRVDIDPFGKASGGAGDQATGGNP